MNQVVSRNFLSYLPLKVGFPFAGVLTDCSFGNVKAQEHNISCIVETLGSEYLHVDLSHISPTWFVGGDPVTVFNLFEIMDGLLDFMLEQIDIEADSGGIFLLKPNYQTILLNSCFLNCCCVVKVFSDTEHMASVWKLTLSINIVFGMKDWVVQTPQNISFRNLPLADSWKYFCEKL